MSYKEVLPTDELVKYDKMARTLMNAQDFLRSYQILQGQFVFGASVVNLALAIELFLKALLYGAGEEVRGHDLEELFERLPPQMKEEIKSAFNDRLVKTTGRCQDIFGFSFETRLKQYARIFVDWRYYHEKNPGSFHSEFCENLAYALNQIAQIQEQQLRTVAMMVRHKVDS
jgi:hypothetical protein